MMADTTTLCGDGLVANISSRLDRWRLKFSVYKKSTCDPSQGLKERNGGKYRVIWAAGQTPSRETQNKWIFRLHKSSRSTVLSVLPWQDLMYYSCLLKPLKHKCSRTCVRGSAGIREQSHRAIIIINPSHHSALGINNAKQDRSSGWI